MEEYPCQLVFVAEVQKQEVEEEVEVEMTNEEDAFEGVALEV